MSKFNIGLTVTLSIGRGKRKLEPDYVICTDYSYFPSNHTYKTKIKPRYFCMLYLLLDWQITSKLNGNILNERFLAKVRINKLPRRLRRGSKRGLCNKNLNLI